MITQDLVLKIVGIIGVLGLVGMGVWEICQNYKKNYRREPDMITYRFDKEDEDKEDE